MSSTQESTKQERLERNLRIAQGKFKSNATIRDKTREVAHATTEFTANDVKLIAACRAAKHGEITVKVVNGVPVMLTRLQEQIDLNKEDMSIG